jgi:hypothetical protein
MADAVIEARNRVDPFGLQLGGGTAQRL